jgi:predicted amidophosphoribosyltransferase
MTRLPEAPEPAGFGNCARCAYRRVGTARICFACASTTIEQIAEQRCLTCDGRLSDTGACGNPLCNQSPQQRGFEFIYAISMRSGRLKDVINRYKYQDRFGWAAIFGRVLVGYLEETQTVGDWDVIIPMPTYVGVGGRSWDHIDRIVERAQIEGPEWPFERGVMSKTEATPRLVEQPDFRSRARVAEQRFGPALRVLMPEIVRGRSVLVFDDVFTSGLTLREVARRLKDAGAETIGGIVLARQPFRP